MTVSNETASITYAGNGATTVFAVPYSFLENSHLRVNLRASSGSESVKVLTTDYTVTGAATEPPTGQVTCVSFTPATGESLQIDLDVPVTQETDYVENDPFPAETHEKALDKLTMIAKQIAALQQKAIHIAATDTTVYSALQVPPATTRASRFLSFDASGNVTTSSGTGADSGLREDIATGNTAAVIRVSTVAAMKALTGLVDGTKVDTLCHTLESSGGAGSYRASTAVVTPDNVRIINNNAGTISFHLLDEQVTFAHCGGIGDGVTNNSAAILVALQTSENYIYFEDKIYAASAVVSTTLPASKKFYGPGTIKWTGVSTSGVMITINCNGNDFEYDIKSDGDDLISAGWLIENSTVMTNPLPACTFKGKTTNFRANAAAAFNSNAYIRGSFRVVDISRGEHTNTSRAALTGAATQTIVVDKKTNSLYPRTVKHCKNIYSGIASDDVGAADFDTDYFVCTMPDPTNFPNGDGTNGYPDIEVESYGNTYINPIGRSEKFQCVPNTHDNTVIRNGDSGSRTMFGGSIDFNLQWGVGECRNQVIYLKGATTSPITTSYVPVSYFQGTDYVERRGSVICGDVIINNQIDSALLDNVSAFVGLQVNVTSSAKPFGLVDIKNVMQIGGTADHAVIMGYDTGAVGTVNIDNVEADFNFNPVAIQTACPDVRLVTKNVRNRNGTSRLLINDVGGGNRAFTGTGFGYNYLGITQTYEWGSTFGPASQLAGAALCDQNANQNSGGALSVQSKYIADEATHVFGKRGFTAGNYIIIVNLTFGAATSQAMFACTGAGAAIVEKTAPAATDFALGVGANPNTAGKMNMWVDGTGQLNIKNRLGSQRAITIAFLG